MVERPVGLRSGVHGGDRSSCVLSGVVACRFWFSPEDLSSGIRIQAPLGQSSLSSLQRYLAAPSGEAQIVLNVLRAKELGHVLTPVFLWVGSRFGHWLSLPPEAAHFRIAAFTHPRGAR